MCANKHACRLPPAAPALPGCPPPPHNPAFAADRMNLSHPAGFQPAGAISGGEILHLSIGAEGTQNPMQGGCNNHHRRRRGHCDSLLPCGCWRNHQVCASSGVKTLPEWLKKACGHSSQASICRYSCIFIAMFCEMLFVNIVEYSVYDYNYRTLQMIQLIMQLRCIAFTDLVTSHGLDRLAFQGAAVPCQLSRVRRGSLVRQLGWLRGVPLLQQPPVQLFPSTTEFQCPKLECDVVHICTGKSYTSSL